MEKKYVYLDNSCTAFPKADGVDREIYEYIKNNVSNINRSSYSRANKVEEMVYDTRSLISNFFNGLGSKNVVFTKNITESLNIVINGLLKDSGHIITSNIEHNAIIRPLSNLKKNGATYDMAKSNEFGEINVDEIENLIKSDTKAIIITHASNVSGSINDIKRVGEIAKRNNLFFIVDTAQTAGVIDIDMKEMNISCLAFTGHKYLLGTEGIGGMIISDELSNIIPPLIYGGTGSISDSEYMPNFLPDKFEAGTQNVSGIIGLKKGIEYIKSIGIKNIKNREDELTEKFLLGLNSLGDKIKIIGHRDVKNRLGVISIVTNNMDLSEVAYKLDSEYNIMVRVGLHCAPFAHKFYGTFPTGTIRFSLGHKTTDLEIEYTLDSLKRILK